MRHVGTLARSKSAVGRTVGLFLITLFALVAFQWATPQASAALSGCQNAACESIEKCKFMVGYLCCMSPGDCDTEFCATSPLGC
jgi:hypothetical protein